MSADLQVLPAWQSNIWNGQQKAFLFYMTVLAVLIFVVKLDCDLRKG